MMPRTVDRSRWLWVPTPGPDLLRVYLSPEDQGSAPVPGWNAVPVAQRAYLGASVSALEWFTDGRSRGVTVAWADLWESAPQYMVDAVFATLLRAHERADSRPRPARPGAVTEAVRS